MAAAVRAASTVPTTPEGTIPVPDIDYAAVSPMLAIAVAAVLSVLLEAFLPRGTRRVPQVVLTVGAAVVALVLVLVVSDDVITAGGAIAVDGVTRFTQATLLVFAILGALLLADRTATGEDAFAPQASASPGSAAEDAARRAGLVQTEVYPLFLFAVLGMLVFPAANDLLTMFVALEVLSLPLYLLSGMARGRRLLSQEAGLKYFLLGSFSSAFFLFGAALLYGYAGSLSLPAIEAAIVASESSDVLLLTGIGFLVVGLLFKIGAVPFHSWTPDVYQGAPTPVTAFMAAATKIAAFVTLLRVLYVALPANRWDWQPTMWAVAIATMVLGSVIAVSQKDVKRMLAYSSIAHAGFILTGALALRPEGISSTLFYLAAYGITTIGAFAAVALVRDGGNEATALTSWAGVGRRSPVFAGMFALFLLALAGIPLTSGFTGKFAVFSAAVAGGAEFLVVVGVLASAVAAFFYARVIALMYFSEPTESTATVAIPSVPLAAVLGVAVVATVVLGVAPGILLDQARELGVFLVP